jgi:hypothetical protein
MYSVRVVAKSCAWTIGEPPLSGSPARAVSRTANLISRVLCQTVFSIDMVSSVHSGTNLSLSLLPPHGVRSTIARTTTPAGPW